MSQKYRFNLNLGGLRPPRFFEGLIMKKHDIIEIAGQIRHETEKAYLFFDGDREVWIPKSHGEWDAADSTMQLPEWMAVEKELI